MNPKLILSITLQGIESIDINADTEQDQLVFGQLLDRIRPCFDAVDALIRKTNMGPQGRSAGELSRE